MRLDGNKMETMQVGMIHYWNLLPLKYELARQPGFEMKMGFPTTINKLLMDGQIHIAPCSSICLSLPGFEMAAPLGIASDGPVQSVYLGLQMEHEPLLEMLEKRILTFAEVFKQAKSLYAYDARQTTNFVWNSIREFENLATNHCPALKITKASATSVVLTKIIYNIWFGANAYEEMNQRKFTRSYNDQRPIELVIGDEALQRKPTFFKVLDLGKIWKDMTDLPFVFAVWQSRGAFLNGWRRKIFEIGELAENKMKIEPSAYLPSILPQDEIGKTILLPEYWKSIYYKLGPKEFRGMLIFLCLARKLHESPMDNSIMVKIARWQEMSQQESNRQFSI